MWLYITCEQSSCKIFTYWNLHRSTSISFVLSLAGKLIPASARIQHSTVESALNSKKVKTIFKFSHVRISKSRICFLNFTILSFLINLIFNYEMYEIQQFHRWRRIWEWYTGPMLADGIWEQSFTFQYNFVTGTVFVVVGGGRRLTLCPAYSIWGKT